MSTVVFGVLLVYALRSVSCYFMLQWRVLFYSGLISLFRKCRLVIALL